MDKKELLIKLEDGLSIEEIPALSLLEEIELILAECSMHDAEKEKIREKLLILRKDTIIHSQVFTSIMKKVIESDKNEY